MRRSSASNRGAAPGAGTSITRRTLALLGLSAGAMATVLAITAGAAEDEFPTPVFLFSCDTARADHFSCYGYARQTTPHLEAWLEEAVLFEQAISEEPWTLPAHATMLTGLHPKRHAVGIANSLAESIHTLPQYLAEAGYQSAGFTSLSLWFEPWRGLGRGFSVYDVPENLRDVFSTYALAQAWLGQRQSPKIFLFAHNIDLHSRPVSLGFLTPYAPPAPMGLHFAKALGDPPCLSYHAGGKEHRAGDFLKGANRGTVKLDPHTEEYITALYDDCVLAVDAALYDFLEYLRTDGCYDDALIIVTADHGEELRDHGRYGHTTVYEECAHIPMIIKFPRGRFAGKRYSGLVQLADIVPTVCQVAGVPIPEGLDGQSLMPFLEGTAAPRPFAHIQRASKTAVRTTSWKFIRDEKNGTAEAFDLEKDPKEKVNRFPDSSPALAPLVKEHARVYAGETPAAEPSDEGLADTQRQLLESLGYLNE